MSSNVLDQSKFYYLFVVRSWTTDGCWRATSVGWTRMATCSWRAEPRSSWWRLEARTSRPCPSRRTSSRGSSLSFPTPCSWETKESEGPNAARQKWQSNLTFAVWLRLALENLMFHRTTIPRPYGNLWITMHSFRNATLALQLIWMHKTCLIKLVR